MAKVGAALSERLLDLNQRLFQYCTYVYALRLLKGQRIFLASALTLLVFSGCRDQYSFEGSWYGVVERADGNTEPIQLDFKADTLRVWHYFGFVRAFQCEYNRGQLLVRAPASEDTVFRIKWANDSTVRLNGVEFWRMNRSTTDHIPSPELNAYCLAEATGTFDRAIPISLFQTDSGTVALLNDRIDRMEAIWAFMPTDYAPNPRTVRSPVAVELGRDVPLSSLVHTMAVVEYFAIDTLYILTNQYGWDGYCQTIVPRGPLPLVEREMLVGWSNWPLPPLPPVVSCDSIRQLEFDASVLIQETFQRLTPGSSPLVFLFDASESVEEFLALCGLISEHAAGKCSIHFRTTSETP